jgi:hypothetical protein
VTVVHEVGERTALHFADHVRTDVRLEVEVLVLEVAVQVHAVRARGDVCIDVVRIDALDHDPVDAALRFRAFRPA